MKIKVLITIVFFSLISCSSKEDSIILLPSDYTGKIVIIYGQQNGSKKLYDGNKRLYKIPPNGVLKSNFQAEYGLSSFPEFYYEGKPNTKLPFVTQYNEIPNNKVVCFGGTSGKANIDYEGTSTIEFTNYYCGTKAQIDEAIKETDTLDYVKLAKQIQ